MVDQEVFDSQLKADRFPFPIEGDITLAVRNANYTHGPVMVQIAMSPGTSLHFKAGKEHGPQITKNGCKLLVLWTERTSNESADLSDFTLVKQRAA